MNETEHSQYQAQDYEDEVQNANALVCLYIVD